MNLIHPMNYCTLEQTDLHSLHLAFIEAFSDYQVKMDISFPDFERMMLRRGFVPTLSVGAFDGEQLIGFSLTGLRVLKGVPTAYDIATGIAPKYRRQGVSSELFMQASRILKKKHVKQYLLEVIKDNMPAIRLYEKQGFQIQRELACFQIKKEHLMTLTPHHHTEQISQIDWQEGKRFWDIEPSWQNSIASVTAIPEAFIHVIVRYNGEFAGYGIIERQSGDIPQLAVHPKFRRLGIGASLLAELANRTQADNIRLLNIDSSEHKMMEFLVSLGLQHFVSQYEMMLKI
ncbi:GNAT family N-acetyltransferase [Paenibacillus silvae]|uniref:GNAT family N-acetyltransferase n=1 Tax=Paenibacillus silvae TaxID=1325358 RepID=UPI0011A6EEBD|nr:MULTISPECIES: GNAT family N-acetyltransferase [Paenibacillus]MCK6077533.1 GNAT family N-acetyltransferase [Paenibacillus silvae]MCK6151735.1 GNAT family N-acetyltransferase [Paenibacillus silvae]MCK6270221.1 GNAT family N-acetyltransferase [Paenibacillus silvae]